jgi:hypothetical protein
LSGRSARKSARLFLDFRGGSICIATRPGDGSGGSSGRT